LFPDGSVRAARRALKRFAEEPFPERIVELDGAGVDPERVGDRLGRLKGAAKR